MTKIFKKSNNTNSGAILGHFCPNLAKKKNNFSGKKGSASFYIFQLSTIVPKIRKNYWTVIL